MRSSSTGKRGWVICSRKDDAIGSLNMLLLPVQTPHSNMKEDTNHLLADCTHEYRDNLWDRVGYLGRSS